MTTETTDLDQTPDDTEATPQQPEESAQTEEQASADSEKHGSKASREAAKYRRQLRETETERDALAARAEAAQRALVEHLIRPTGILPKALWASGAKLSDLIDESGAVDATALEAACMVAREELGIPAPARPDMGQGARGAASTPDKWTGAFKRS